MGGITRISWKGRVQGAHCWSGLILLAAALPGQAAITPTITVSTPIDCGSVITGASTGTLVLGLSPVPSGVRSTTGGTTRGASASWSLGAVYLTGAQGDTYSLVNAGAANITLTDPISTKTMTVAFSSMGHTAIIPAVSKFPPGTAGTSTSTNTFYYGLTVQVKQSNQNPTGTYLGNLPLRLTDSSNGLSSQTNLPITIRVDPTGISIAKVTDLSFGALLGSGVAGTAIMTPAGGRSPTGGVTLGAFSPGGAASFTVTGGKGAHYSITLPAGTITLTAPGGTLAVSAFTSTPSGSGTLGTVAPNAGSQTLTVGATVAVAANQAEGDYSGTFNVTVAYQ